MKNKWENKNFFNALKNSLNGIFYVIKNENNIKIELIFAFFTIIASILLKINLIETILIVFVIFLVLFAECINTAIETVVNLYTEEYNEKAKIAKDISAGGVLIVSILSVIIGVLIFLPKIIKVFLVLIQYK